jgi:hypothetical protein
MYDRPLNALFEMTAVSLKSRDPDFDYDHSKADKFIDAVDEEVRDRLHNREKQEIRGLAGGARKKPNTRNIGGYEEKISIQLAGKYVVFAENQAEAGPYLVCNVKSDNPLNLEESCNEEVFADYVEAMRGFTNLLDGLVCELETERCAFGLAPNKLTAAECLPNSRDMEFEGKLLIVNAEFLAREYRSAEHQLVLCTGGFGASPNSLGRAVYVKELHSGKECRYNRHQIEGVADFAKLPQWAQNNLKAEGSI